MGQKRGLALSSYRRAWRVPVLSAREFESLARWPFVQKRYIISHFISTLCARLPALGTFNCFLIPIFGYPLRTPVVDTCGWTPVEDTSCGHLLLDTCFGYLLRTPVVDTYCWTPVEDTRCGHLLLDTRCGHLLFDTR